MTVPVEVPLFSVKQVLPHGKSQQTLHTDNEILGTAVLSGFQKATPLTLLIFVPLTYRGPKGMIYRTTPYTNQAEMILISQGASPKISWWSFCNDGERDLADWSVPINDPLLVRPFLEVYARGYLHRTLGIVPQFDGEILLGLVGTIKEKPRRLDACEALIVYPPGE